MNLWDFNEKKKKALRTKAGPEGLAVAFGQWVGLYRNVTGWLPPLIGEV